MGSSLYSAILLLLFAFCLSLPTLSPATELKGVDIENPVLEVIPAPLAKHSAVPGSKDVLFCKRARVSGISRLKLGSYASSLKVTLSTSLGILERLLSKIQVCFHRNNTLGLCQCEEDDWKNIQKGLWSSVMSPYDERYVDVKFIGKIPGSVTITVEEDFQRWRLVCLALGFTLLLLAAIVSNGYRSFSGHYNHSLPGNEVVVNWKENCPLSYHVWISGSTWCLEVYCCFMVTY
ncbi:hypothetical protein ACFX2I_008424 [Malus domestica]